ncbi:MAG: hypothetical protein Q7R31_04385 [Candidatus Levybacteria bacterium]|nr:hypothetical protein [Candidatus Levybacteria bacterium]
MQKSIKKAVLRTLIYSDIFDYPLSKEEIWRFLIGQKIGRESFKKELKSLAKSESTPLGCSYKNNFHYLLGREKIVEKRIEREKISRRKLKIARKAARWLSYIPTTLFVGVSGALALKNSHKDDDIDLFIVTSKNTLWFTRLLMVILLMLIGQYRKRNAKDVCDKICLNMLIDETSLQLPLKQQDLYGAHEVIQLMPISVKNNMHHRFLQANKWTEKFLPNAIERTKSGQKKSLFLIHNSLFILEWLAKQLQLWFINKHKTIEVVSDNFLAFHPLNYRRKILNLYNQKIKKYGI